MFVECDHRTVEPSNHRTVITTTSGGRAQVQTRVQLLSQRLQHFTDIDLELGGAIEGIAFHWKRRATADKP